MKRLLFLSVAVWISISFGLTAAAERLELGVAATPMVLQDDNYEAFSRENMYAFRFGLDLRSEVASPGGFGLLPFIAYRVAFDEGEPYGMVDTNLTNHDFLGGLRVRRNLVSWLAFFVEAAGGLSWADLKGSINLSAPEASGADRRNYADDKFTWQAQGLAGVEVGLSKTMLESRGIRRFGFGGELAGGYVRRGDTGFEPDLQGGDEFALRVADGPSWGEVNLSGWVIQAAINLKFF